MKLTSIQIVNFTTSDYSELLRLLLELHSTYFNKYASPRIKELQEEKNLKTSYEIYLNDIASNKDDVWHILLAKSETDSIGFIIGSIQEDNSFILDKAGIVEDWFVDESYRGEGIGLKLYQELEKWFILKKCKQVCSETWQGNELSINSHFKNGFFISGVTFGKKL